MSYLAYLIPEGVDASDGRSIAKGALTWREGNLPLMATDAISGGHDGAVFVANLTNLRREDVDGTTWILADVDWDSDEVALEAKRLVDEDRLAGISADIAVDMRDVMGPVEDADEGREPAVDGFELLKGEILGGSIVPHPAFADARIVVDNNLILVAAAGVGREVWSVKGVLVADGSVSVPDDVKAEASQGIKWRRSHKRGGSIAAERQARRLTDDDCDDDLCRSIARWYRRNSKIPDGDGFKEGTAGFPSNGRIAWALHGGDAGQVFADKAVSAQVRRALDSLIGAAIGDTGLPVAALDRAWDADAATTRMAERAGGTDDLDGSEYARGFLYRDDDADPTTVGAYKLPFADVIDGTLTTVPRGVYAAAGALSGGRGGVDIPSGQRKAVEGKACSLYGSIGKAYPDDDVPDCPLTAALAAHAAPDDPPVDFLTNPKLTEPTPLTVTDDGHVYGHLYLKGTCHVGIQGQCVRPPDDDDFSNFLAGKITCSDGSVVAVGQITMDTTHADVDPSITAIQAQGHYAHTGWQAVDVTLGYDDWGVWYSGALLPGVDGHRLAATGKVSGDWRWIDGGLKLVAILAVNSPGFPVPRVGLAADGHPTALVSAGVIDTWTADMVEADPIVDLLTEQIILLRRLVASDRAQRILASVDR